jgi:hypothetical protein
MTRMRSQRGQAVVEVVALLPVIVLVALAGWQVVSAAHAWTVSASAARAAARAQEVGAPAEPAARAVAGGRRGLEVRTRVARDGTASVEVSVRAPRSPRWAPVYDITGPPARVRSARGTVR